MSAIEKLNSIHGVAFDWNEKFLREKDPTIKFYFAGSEKPISLKGDEKVDIPDEFPEDIKSEIEKKPVLFYSEDRIRSCNETYVESFPLEKVNGFLRSLAPRPITLGFEQMPGEYGEIPLRDRSSIHSREGKEGQRFRSGINEQGSGVRLAIPLLTKILAEKENKDIILIDEPELGLNPSAKQEFLNQLLELSEKGKQFFIATHDSSFINPIWRGDYEDIAVYLYSPINSEFIRVTKDSGPSSFAGFMPQSMSLKGIHIYTEGFVDVNVLQGTLYNYLRKKFSKWYKIWNNVGIYHLQGDNWKHLLYTVVKSPYKAVVILDGNKREEVEKEIGKLNEYGANRLFPKFELCSLSKLKDAFQKDDTCPIYCLQKNDIKEYFGGKDVGDQKAIDAAWDNKGLLEEFFQIFNGIFSFGRCPIFYDDFEEFTGWQDYKEGRVERSSDFAFKGKYSLKKTTHSDPNGGYKELPERVGLNIVFSGWIYRPSDSISMRAVGDRVAIEDENFNGYGFLVGHSSQKNLQIERREGGKFTKLANINTDRIVEDKWYQFKFYLKQGGRFCLYVYDESGEEIGRIEDVKDESYTSFDRVVVHGGYDYYLDCLKVECL